MNAIRCRRLTFAALLPLLVSLPAFGQGYAWYRFSKTFITSHYTHGDAFGSLTASSWDAAKNVHPIECGGDDGELHIGIFNKGLSDPTQPPSLAAKDDEDWGQVAELPDAANGDGVDQLKSATGKVVTFTGYFRVWNEGHDKGAVHPSNPHHVLEVHPAWAFATDDGGISFEDLSLVHPMDGYQGYGATLFRPIFASVLNEEWPLAYQDNEYVYLKLRKAQNFYQLPVAVKQVKTITGGHEAVVEVFSDNAFTKSRYETLRCITAKGSPYDTLWKEGEKTYLLGFFSVNLSRALGGAGQASTEGDAIHVPEALEFFVFGRPLGKAIASCAK